MKAILAIAAFALVACGGASSHPSLTAETKVKRDLGYCESITDRDSVAWKEGCVPLYDYAQNALEWCRSNRDAKPDGYQKTCVATGIYDDKVESLDRAAEVIYRDFLAADGVNQPTLVVYDETVDCLTHSIDFVAYCFQTEKILTRLAQIFTYGPDFDRNSWAIMAHELEPSRMAAYGTTLEASQYVELHALYHVTLWACLSRLDNFERLVTVQLPSLGPPGPLSNYGTREMREAKINEALEACAAKRN